ncbi:GPW/gp25 family protein [Gangjinia marincola]|uniref:GPW/gp25 family protein n=1 Tax=Gangjinia marincola TaxID=578463 RepID=A0ABN1MJJ4_9FLAO
MNFSYYDIPLSFDKMLSKKEPDLCSIKESIANYIHLIATSYFGECTFDERFGCAIWNIDFDNLTSANKMRDKIASSISSSIRLKEKRLSKVSVEVSIKQEEFTNKRKLNRIKKRVDITIHGTVKQTNEPFAALEQFYIAPLSY